MKCHSVIRIWQKNRFWHRNSICLVFEFSRCLDRVLSITGQLAMATHPDLHILISAEFKIFESTGFWSEFDEISYSIALGRKSCTCTCYVESFKEKIGVSIPMKVCGISAIRKKRTTKTSELTMVHIDGLPCCNPTQHIFKKWVSSSQASEIEQSDTISRSPEPVKSICEILSVSNLKNTKLISETNSDHSMAL